MTNKFSSFKCNLASPTKDLKKLNLKHLKKVKLKTRKVKLTPFLNFAIKFVNCP